MMIQTFAEVSPFYFKVPSYFQGVHETQVTRFVSHTLRLTKHLGSNCKQIDFNGEK